MRKQDFREEELPINKPNRFNRACIRKKTVASERKILGPEKNAEGQTMAQVLYVLEKGVFPTDEQRREYHSTVTGGHSYSITDIYEARVTAAFTRAQALKDPEDIASLLRREFQKFNPISIHELQRRLERTKHGKDTTLRAVTLFGDIERDEIIYVKIVY